MSLSKEIIKETLDQESLDNISWHSLSDEDVLNKLKSSKKGLNEIQVSERKKTFGANQLPSKEATPVYKLFLAQFMNPLIYILLAAAIASILIGETIDAIFIGIVISINAFIGTYQEWKAGKSAEALQNLLKITTHVQRNNEKKQLNAEDLVPGDIVFLESGVKYLQTYA